ncbi:DNA polymerase Y family protein [Aureimonas sp. SK2]|uniref:DNA polymerase Y family protein n=1 Tax=Aureimonas sp. SK2 TaxID=3015992 RepID=UPI0024447596|nr:DNA polymerase Y family protein [Aureimonas sp. SK2]
MPLGSGNGHRPPAGLLALSDGADGPAEPGVPPLALFGREDRADRIVALCERAAALGLMPGLGLAEARARFPHVDYRPMDAAADRRLLEAVADWCDRYTPLVALDGTEGLLLDLSGASHLFGGVAALRDDLLARLRAQGFAAEAVVAAHPGTARACVGLRETQALVPAGGERAAVEGLPAGPALRLAPEEAGRLHRLGLRRVGDLLALPRAGLQRRFGPDLARRLDEATGAARRPIAPRRPVAMLIRERRLFEPVSLTEDILRLVSHLAARLCETLAERGEGLREAELALFRVDGHVERMSVRTGTPLRDPARIARLFAERLKMADEEIDAGFGFDLLRLSVLAADAMAERQEELAGEGPRPAEDLGALIDRLGTRLGEAAVFALSGEDRHRPEAAQRPAAPFGAASMGLSADLAPRPLRLFARPEAVEATAEVPDGPIRQFRWRRAFYRVGRIEGPERIAPEWWRGDTGAERDYFRVEDEAGRRYWLFREGAGPGAPSGWFLHGLFA